MKRQKHYHVEKNQKIASRHNDVKTRVQGMGMVFGKEVATAAKEIDEAAAMFAFTETKKDFSEADLSRYITIMNDVTFTCRYLVPTSDLEKILTKLRDDAVKHITGNPHDPHLDQPSDAAVEAARKILFPNGDADAHVPVKQMHKDVLNRIAKFLEHVPKQHGGVG